MDRPDDARPREAHWSELEPTTAYHLAALRGSVFVVEQNCAYLDLDGRDLEPGARQLWIEGDAHDGGATVRAALRVLPEPSGGQRIGRVVTDPDHRHHGHATRLMHAALDREGPFVLDAQTYLIDWYRGFGFVTVGAPFLEDGIPHCTMRRS